jgi:hypothetical protein
MQNIEVNLLKLEEMEEHLNFAVNIRLCHEKYV